MSVAAFKMSSSNNLKRQIQIKRIVKQYVLGSWYEPGIVPGTGEHSRPGSES